MITYTNKIKHDAINKLLSSLFDGCNEYNNDATGAWNCIIEPDIKALNDFRLKLCYIGELIRTYKFNELKNHLEDDTIPFVDHTGFKYGHVTGSYTTGSWGVRIGELKDILKVLELTNIPDFYNKTGMMYDLKIKIIGIEVSNSGNYLWLNLQPDNREVNSFKIDLNWENIKNNDYRGLVLD